MLFVTSRRMRTRSAMRASKHIDPPVSLWAWTKSVIVLNTLLGWLWQMQKVFSARGRKEKYGPDIIRLSRRRYRIIKKNRSLQLMRYMDAGREKKMDAGKHGLQIVLTQKTEPRSPWCRFLWSLEYSSASSAQENSLRACYSCRETVQRDTFFFLL